MGSDGCVVVRRRRAEVAWCLVPRSVTWLECSCTHLGAAARHTQGPVRACLGPYNWSGGRVLSHESGLVVVWWQWRCACVGVCAVGECWWSPTVTADEAEGRWEEGESLVSAGQSYARLQGQAFENCW